MAAKAQGFEWNLVRSFLAALDQGSLLGAAKVLKLSQPTVGRHLTELEAQLGVTLFVRTPRGLVASAAALQVADAARGMEQQALRFSQVLAGVQAKPTGTVRLTASPPVAVALLPGVLARMRQELPDIHVEVVASNQISDLLRREADIAIRMVRPAQASLVAKKLGDVGLGVYAHRSYLASHPPLHVPTDLLQHVLIGSDTDTSILQGFAALGYRVGRDAFALRTDDFIVQWQAIRAGFGIGFVANYMVREEVDVVRILPAVLKIPPLPMWLAVHREIRTNRRMRAVYDFLAQELPRLL